MPFFPIQLPEQLPARNAFANGGGAGSCCLIKMNNSLLELSNNYPNNYPPRHHWEMRSERVVARVVVLEGKASAVQMKRFTHFSVSQTPVQVWCGTHPACLGFLGPSHFFFKPFGHPIRTLIKQDGFLSVFFRIGSNLVSNPSKPKRVLCHRFVIGCQGQLFRTSHPGFTHRRR